MTSSSHKATQVSYKPNPCNFHLFLVCSCNNNLISYQFWMTKVEIKIPHNTSKYPKYANTGHNLRYEIGRETKQPPANKKQKLQVMLTLIVHYVATSLVQEYDHDMTDSSSLPNHKRTQLHIQLSNLQKKTRSDLQPERAQYTNQDIWLGFHTMELLATDNEAPLQEVNTSIREMIRKGYQRVKLLKFTLPKFPSHGSLN